MCWFRNGKFIIASVGSIKYKICGDCMVSENLLHFKMKYHIIILSFHPRMSVLRDKLVMEFGMARNIMTVSQIEECLCH